MKMTHITGRRIDALLDVSLPHSCVPRPISDRIKIAEPGQGVGMGGEGGVPGQGWRLILTPIQVDE